MVLGITLKKAGKGEEARRVAAELEVAAGLSKRFRELQEADVAAFDVYMAAYRLPRGTDQEREERQRRRRLAAADAADVPLRVMEAGVDTLRAIARVRILGRDVPLRAESDLEVAAELARAVLVAAEHTAAANFAELSPEALADAEACCARLKAESQRVSAG